MKKFWFDVKVGLFFVNSGKSYFHIVFNWFITLFFFFCLFSYAFACSELGSWFPFDDSFDIVLSYDYFYYYVFIVRIVLFFFVCDFISFIIYRVLKKKDKYFYYYIENVIYRRSVFKEKVKISYNDFIDFCYINSYEVKEDV